MQKIHLKIEPLLTPKHNSFSYQVEAVEAIREREYAAIFHEQGLGKTKIAIDLILYWLDKKTIDTVLLIVKKGLIDNWQKELDAHTFIKPRILTQSRRDNFFVFNSPSRVMIAHYEIIKSEHDRFKLFLQTRNVGVILDESSKIKNPNSELTKELFDLAPLFKRRIIMTGTPVANRPYDLWAQIWFLDQGKSLGEDFRDFKQHMDLSNKLSDDIDAQNEFEIQIEGVHKKLSPFSVRETKRKGIIELPDKIIQSIIADWEPKQLDLYRRIRNETSAVIVRDNLLIEDDSEEVLKRLLRLVQATSNPKLIDDSYVEEPGKLAPLKDILGDISQKGEKSIIWTCFTGNVEWLKREFSEYNPASVYGKLSMDERNRALDRFKSDKSCKVLIATPGAAKEGLTLTVANHAIFYDRGFSLDDYLQAQDRIHRISQAKTCFVYNIIMNSSIDEWIDILLHAKRLAAQLSNGDISREFYKSQISYSFGDVLKEVLKKE